MIPDGWLSNWKMSKRLGMYYIPLRNWVYHSLEDTYFYPSGTRAIAGKHYIRETYKGRACYYFNPEIVTKELVYEALEFHQLKEKELERP